MSEVSQQETLLIGNMDQHRAFCAEMISILTPDAFVEIMSLIDKSRQMGERGIAERCLAEFAALGVAIALYDTRPSIRDDDHEK